MRREPSSRRPIVPPRRGRLPLYAALLLLFQVSFPTVVLQELFRGPVVCKMACAGTPDCCCAKRAAAAHGHRPVRRDGPTVEREACPTGCAVSTSARPGTGTGLRPSPVATTTIAPSHSLVQRAEVIHVSDAPVPGQSRAPPA